MQPSDFKTIHECHIWHKGYKCYMACVYLCSGPPGANQMEAPVLLELNCGVRQAVSTPRLHRRDTCVDRRPGGTGNSHALEIRVSSNSKGSLRLEQGEWGGLVGMESEMYPTLYTLQAATKWHLLWRQSSFLQCSYVSAPLLNHPASLPFSYLAKKFRANQRKICFRLGVLRQGPCSFGCLRTQDPPASVSRMGCHS